eukprot:Hpha_TRINITY_DN15425_c3_g6::TRINITY_DN15425_c3_g6_i1::g.177138::m.177138
MQEASVAPGLRFYAAALRSCRLAAAARMGGQGSIPRGCTKQMVAAAEAAAERAWSLTTDRMGAWRVPCGGMGRPDRSVSELLMEVYAVCGEADKANTLLEGSLRAGHPRTKALVLEAKEA